LSKSTGDELFAGMRAVALLPLLPWIANAQPDPKDILKQSQQCLVVITDSWQSASGRMFTFERAENSSWQQHRRAIPVVIGKAGLGWGRGLTRLLPATGPVKAEGDNRSPAGIFRLGSVFGYSAKNPGTKMPYIALTKTIVGVNDPSSRYYNQMVDASRIKAPDWHSVEPMILADNRYKWGVLVQHNVPAKAGAGSCIFLHIRKDSQTPTAGCTAMPEENLLEIIHWLDPAQHPLLVQLPASLYQMLCGRWNLPRCHAAL
jgi:zinc D-Ala-D-Ala dipeptidase